MSELSDREEQVLALVAEGVPTKGIAERLWISVATVRNHIQRAMQKLGVSTRIQAVNAWKTNLHKPEERVLAYCRRSGIRLTDLQVSLLRAALGAQEVACTGTSHVFAQNALTCLCGKLRGPGT
jgi:DNA-binding CsgD family transcriptional regulator